MIWIMNDKHFCNICGECHCDPAVAGGQSLSPSCHCDPAVAGEAIPIPVFIISQ